MKTKLLMASLAAMLLTAPMAMAEDAPIVVAEEAAAPAAVTNYLSDKRAPAELSRDELVARLREGAALMQIDGVAKPLRQQINQYRRALFDELKSRKAAAQAAKPAPAETAPAVEEAAKPSQPEKPAAASKPAPAGIPDEVASFLAGGGDLKGLSNQELVARVKLARRLLALEGLPGPTRRDIANQRKAAADEVRSRQNAGAAAPPKAEAATPPKAGETTPPKAGAAPASGADLAAADAMLADKSPVATLGDEELRAKTAKARELSRNLGLPKDKRRALIAVFRDLRTEALRRKSAGPVKPATPPPATPGKDEMDKATGSADAESTAKSLIAAPKADAMKDAELGAHLRGIRELLKDNKISRPTKLAILARLKDDREVFRARVAKRKLEGGTKPTGGTTTNNTTTNTTINNTTVINNITNIQQVKVVLRDRRPPERLRDDELRFRILAYREANDRRINVWNDPEFGDGDRLYWREQMIRDRVALRNRLIAARQQRANSLRIGVSDGGLSFGLDLNFTERPSRPPPPPSIFAAEADDEEIETQLIAPPARKPARRYTVKEIEDEPEIRAAMPSIEIDTIKFGFGEANVREEEVESLDNIAEVIEKILAKSPGEVFLIEGHTDAVGSDASNLELSRKRAAAVIESLTTYYVIPARNLKPVGYGERQLKIPTAEAEQENRRVSIRRVTPLVGGLDD